MRSPTRPTSSSTTPITDGYSNQSVSANVGVTFAPGQEARAQYFRSRLNNQFDGSANFDDRTITTAEMWQVQSRNRLASFWVSQLSAAQGTDDSQTQMADGTSPFKTTQRQYTWQNEFALPLGALTAGYERREERLATDLAFATTSRDTDSVFGLYQLRVDAQAVQANLRHDESSQYGGQTTGAIAYSYRPSPSWRLTAGYSTGFKAPSFNDLYFPNFSNPNLAPETSRNVEGGVYWNGAVAGAAVEARVIGYRNRISQLIVFQCDADFRYARRRTWTAPRSTASRSVSTCAPSMASRLRPRSTCNRRRTISPANCCRGARGSTARWPSATRLGPCALASRSSPRRCATTIRIIS